MDHNIDPKIINKLARMLHISLILLMILSKTFGDSLQLITNNSNNNNSDGDDKGEIYFGNNLIKKSDAILKFPTYTLKMPHSKSSGTTITRRGSNIDPISESESNNTSQIIYIKTVVSCSSKNITDSIMQIRKKIGCAPRETIIDLVGPDNSKKIIPSAIVLKRCGGICSGGKKCISAGTKTVSFFVRSLDDDDEMFCNKIQLVEDTHCRCGCIPDKQKCLPSQKYNKNLCKCVCANRKKYKECMDKAQSNFKWDQKTCSCICKIEKSCTTGTVWVPNQCRCIKP